MANPSCPATVVENKNSTRTFVAVASLDGTQVNQHVGAAERVLIYQLHPKQLGTFLFMGDWRAGIGVSRS
jgi:hypothetical protein